MNERIKELAEQARKYVADAIELGFPQDQVDDIRDEKFAELIIEDACRALSPMLRDMISRGQGVDAIKKHFGVEDIEEDSACPLCGEDGGTTCGMPGCQY